MTATLRTAVSVVRKRPVLRVTRHQDQDRTESMRCPHCATAVAAPPICHVCGSRLDAPVAEHGRLDGLEPTSCEADQAEVEPEPVAGLEPTRILAPDVDAERMPGLITNEEAFGDASIPDDQQAGPPSVCPRCGASHDVGRFCARCGRTVDATAAAAARPSEPPMVICLECGAPNPARRNLCMSCGSPQ